MESYWKNCNRCGQRIIMAETPTGSWQPLDPNGSGKHYCRSSADNYSFRENSASPGSSSTIRYSYSAYGWNIHELDEPLTYLTKCWWCGAEVFFHTNGFGDCVLLDDLGCPWKVHECWELHREERRTTLDKFEQYLKAQGFNGVFYKPFEDQVKTPPKSGILQVSINGFVINNYALTTKARAFYLNFNGKRSNNSWIQFDIGVIGGRQYPFALPRSIAEKIKNYSIVHIEGEWQRCSSNWIIRTIRLIIIEFPSDKQIIIEITSI